MTRALHLIDPVASGPLAPTSLAAFLSNDEADTASHVVVLGGAFAADRAVACGLDQFDRIAPPLHRPALAWRALRALLRSRPPCDVVVAWSAGCAALARFALPWTPAVAMIGESPARAAPGLVVRRTLSGFDPASVCFAGERIRAEWAALEPPLRDAALLPPPCPHARGDAVRARWRALWESGEDPVIGFVADDESAVDAHEASFVVGVLGLARQRVVGVAPARSHSIHRAWRLAERYDHRWPLILENEPIPSWIGSCDVVCAIDGPGSTLACAARSLGVPVVPRRDPRGLAGDLLDALEHQRSAGAPGDRLGDAPTWRRAAARWLSDRLRPVATASPARPAPPAPSLA